MFIYLEQIALSLFRAGIANMDEIVIGRANFYDNESISLLIVIDVRTARPVSWMTKDDNAKIVLMQAELDIEFRGEKADEALQKFLTRRLTDKFRKAMQGISLKLQGEVITFRDLHGSRFFNRMVLQATAMFYIQDIIDDDDITNFDKISYLTK